MFGGPKLIKGDGATGAKGATDDNIEGLVMGGVVVAGKYPTLGVSEKLIQPSDADALGFNAAYDANNKVLVRYHIDEFFALNPAGTLWIMIVAQTTTMAQMCDKSLPYVQKLVSDSGNKVKIIGCVRNPAVGYTATITDGVDADVLNAIPKAQQLMDDWASRNILIDNIVIEGRELSAVAADWKDFRTMAAPGVHVCGMQDKDVANLDALYAKHAAVGTSLGGLGVRRVEEDLGSVNSENNPVKGTENFPINDAATGRWLNPALSSGILTKDLTEPEVTALKAQAIIFADSYPDYDGVYFSGSPTCTDIGSDFAFGVATRVWNKAGRIVIKKLTPKINSKVETADGKIKATTLAGWEADVKDGANGLTSLVSNGHATNVDLTISPDQDALADSEVEVDIAVTPFAYARTVKGKLGFSRK